MRHQYSTPTSIMDYWPIELRGFPLGMFGTHVLASVFITHCEISLIDTPFYEFLALSKTLVRFEILISH